MVVKWYRSPLPGPAWTCGNVGPSPVSGEHTAESGRELIPIKDLQSGREHPG